MDMSRSTLDLLICVGVNSGVSWSLRVRLGQPLDGC
jgi:hypothetical protein